MMGEEPSRGSTVDRIFFLLPLLPSVESPGGGRNWDEGLPRENRRNLSLSIWNCFDEGIMFCAGRFAYALISQISLPLNSLACSYIEFQLSYG